MKAKQIKNTEITPENISACFRDLIENQIDWSSLLAGEAEALSEEQKREKIYSTLDRLSGEMGKAAQQGLQEFTKRDKSGKISKQLSDFEQFVTDAKIAEAGDLITDEIFATMIKMANDTYRDGEASEAAAMYSFLQVVQPLAVEPMIGQLTIEWEQRGAERAADLYEAVVDLLKNPMLDMFGAECLLAAKRKERARALRERALKNLTEDEDFRTEYADIEPDVRELLKEINA